MTRWLTVRQVAEWLNCSQSHVYNLVERGDLPARRWGRLVRVPAESLEYEEHDSCLDPDCESSISHDLGTSSGRKDAGAGVVRLARLTKPKPSGS